MTFTVLIVISGVLLVVGATLALVRVEKGPTTLDRTIALDILTAAIVGAVAIDAAWSRRVEDVPILVAISLIGFVTSVTIARFAAAEPEGEGRILSREEMAAMEAKRLEAASETVESGEDREHLGGPAPGEVRE